MRVTVHGVTLTVEFDLNRHDHVVGSWVGVPPQCPTCHESLTAFGEGTRTAPLDAHGRVACDGCGTTWTEVA